MKAEAGTKSIFVHERNEAIGVRQQLLREAAPRGRGDDAIAGLPTR